MIFVYKLLIVFFFILLLPVLPFLYVFSTKRRATLGPRLGLTGSDKIPEKKKRRLWVHALSVGEVKSSLPLIQALENTKKDFELVFSASTKTGYEIAEKLFLSGEKKFVDHLMYFPFDLGWSVQRILKQIDPDAIVLVETDLWPNFLYEAKKIDIPVLLINARLSQNSLKGYLRFKPFVQMFLSGLKFIMVQSDVDRERFLQLGLDENKILKTGNVKFDQTGEKVSQDGISLLKDRLGIEEGRPVVLCGSTHSGEEEILCNVFKQLSGEHPELVMIIAPRNPDRSQELLNYFNARNVNAVLMTECENRLCESVMIVDTMGELARLYSICDIAFVGGSLVPEGGHNPLEPALFAKPVLFGPDMSDFVDISDLLIRGQGSIQVQSEDELTAQVGSLLADVSAMTQKGSQNLKVFTEHSGAVDRIISHMEYHNIV